MAEYTNVQLEGLLSSAIARALPNLREAAASAPVTPLEGPDDIVPARSTRPSALRRTALSLAACLVLVLGLGSFAFLRPLSVIGIDVNPSIELTANYFDKVLSITPLNEDAITIIGDMDLRYVDLDIAVNALVGSMALHGYFESGQDVAVLVSVSGGSARHNQKLQAALATDIESAASALGANANVYTHSTDQPPPPPAAPSPTPTPTASTPRPTPDATPSATPGTPVPPAESAKPAESTKPSPATPPKPATARERAAQNGISYGKQVFLDKLLALDPTLKESELVPMPIGKLAALAKQRGLDLSGIVDYDPDDSVKENIEDFIDDIDDPDDDKSATEQKDDGRDDSGNHKGWYKDDDDDDRDDDDDDEDDD